MTETTLRLFVAVMPPEHVVEHLETVIEPMRAARPDLHWVATPRLHVTVTFMPHVEPAVADDLGAVVETAAADLAPVRVSIAGSGRFDEHVLWAGLAGDLDGLATIASRVASAVGAAGAGPEQRRTFRPHVSLARAAGRLDAHLGPLAEQLDAYAGPVWQVDELHLVRSHLGRVLRHETLAVLPLGG